MSNSATPEPGTERALRSSTRNPRRRPRQSDQDSIKTAPRRKRSKISENTFVPPRHDEENEEEISGTVEVAMANSAVTTPSPKRGRGRPKKVVAPALDVEIPVRSKKNSVKRPSRGDGATILTQTARYSVKLLPSTPKDLRREGTEFRGSLGAAHHALAVTREKAYVWDYTSHAPVNNPRVFDIPFPVRPIEILPFGALVTTGVSTDIGLVLISATTGKVYFYESIERASTLGLFQERNVGVEGSLGNLFSGETVIDIVSAHHVGFVVTLSSGRIAQLTLRDTQGKAKVSAQFLRATDPNSGGLFGSIKGFLGSAGWKRDVAAVHTRQLGTRGQVQVMSLTERAEFQIWDLDWSGQYRFKSILDFKEVITGELRKLESPELQGKAENVTALDFSILEKTHATNEIATVGVDLPLDVLVLLRVGPPNDHEYVLAKLAIEGQNVVVPQVNNLRTYRNQSARGTQIKPHLLLPRPGHTALVAFEDAIVLHALDDSDANSPEAQLRASYIQPVAFEDSLYLRGGKSFTILGGSEEDEKGIQGSSVVFVKGAGLARVSAVDPKDSDQEERISVKSKIEQAVFHGALQEGNILDFSRVNHGQYSPEDVAQAALEISDEILRSTSSFISTSPTDVNVHLAYKAQALQALVNHVRQNYPTVSNGAMWRLLWDAEKVAAAQQMWNTFEDHVSASSQDKATATVMDEVCSLRKLEEEGVNEERAQNSGPFMFFVHHLHHFERLFHNIVRLVEKLSEQDDMPSTTKIRSVLEANDLWNKALEAVFAFRNDNAASYGVLPEFIEDGVLIDVAEYADLPEFWTSTDVLLKGVVKVAERSRTYARTEWDKNENNANIAPVLKPMIEDVNSQNPRLVQLMCLIYQERINWSASRSSEKDRDLAEKLRASYEDQRYKQFQELQSIAQTEAGLRLAEKYKDMHLLAMMILAEWQFYLDSFRDSGNTQQEISEINIAIDHLMARIGKCFDRFGEAWADAYFDVCFSNGKAGLMLRDAQEKWQVPLTKYLRAEPSRAKFCWINDVTTDKDFLHAGESLIKVGDDQETKLWAKKVELSMGKLALLAMQEELTIDSLAMENGKLQGAMPQDELELVSVQERLYRHMLPEIVQCIDHDAEVEVAMQKFASGIKDLHALKQLLETYMDRLLDHLVLSGDELIDILTLIDGFITDDLEDRNLQGNEYFLALKVLNAMASHIPQDRFETLLALIWKRCYIHDDWVDINSATKRVGDEAAEKFRETAPWRTIHAIMDQGFFDSSNCYVRHLLPSECLGAGCQSEDLSYRWSNQDLLDPILNDNKIHDEQLRSLVTDRRLDQWIQACAEDAKRVIEADAEEKAQQVVREQEFEASVQAGQLDGTKTNGHIANGVFKDEMHRDETGSEVLDIEVF